VDGRGRRGWSEANGARIIDINMGCPAKKVTNGWSGSALLREPDHALRLIEAVVGAVKVPGDAQDPARLGHTPA
jgi:tRNA-dihydrouridine synthase